MEISVDTVQEFISQNGGKVKNSVLVAYFKKVLNDPATKDLARQKFKECVNTVAVVKTIDNEKYVQLKKKYRKSSGFIGSGEALPEPPPPPPQEDSVEQSSSNVTDAVTTPNASYTTTDDLPYADADASQSGSSFLTERKSRVEAKQASPSKEHHTGKHKKSPEHSPAKGSNQGSPAKETPRKSLSKNTELVKKHEEISTDFRNSNKQITDPAESKRLSVPCVTDGGSSKSETRHSSGDNFAVPATVPLRKKKKENIPPSPNAERWTSVDRVKSSLMNLSAENRMNRIRPSSIAQGSYTGSVERARQNFQSKQKLNDDSASLALSEKSLDSKGEELDDDYDRNIPNIALDMNEKSWIIRSAQGNLVEMRILLDIDPTLAEKKSALHWAAKKGNVEMMEMVLDQNVDVNVKTGYTPLHLAAMHGHDEAIKLLLEKGADANARDYSGHKPIYYIKSLSMPLKNILFGNEGGQQGQTKDFAAGLRSRNPAVRKSQYLLSNAISGGFSSVGLLVSKTNEDHLRQPEYEHKLSKDGTIKIPKMGKMKKSKKVKDDKPRISVVSVDDSDSGFVNLSSSSMSQISLSSSSSLNLMLSTPSTPNSQRRRSGNRNSIETNDSY